MLLLAHERVLPHIKGVILSLATDLAALLESGLTVPNAAVKLGFSPSDRKIKQLGKEWRAKRKFDREAVPRGEGGTANITEDIRLAAEWEHDQAQEEPTDNWLLPDNYTYNEISDTYITFMTSTPKPIVMPGSKHRAMMAAYSNWDGQPGTINEICRNFAFPRNWFIEYKQKHGWTHDMEPFSAEEVMAKNPNELVADALQMRRAVIHQKFEQEKWKETKKDAEKWRELSANILEPLSAALLRLAGRKETLPKLLLPKAKDPFITVFTPFQDIHFGKHATDHRGKVTWSKEIAGKRAVNSVAELLADTAKHGQPEKIMFIVGSDDLHVDGKTLATTAGTPQGPQSDGDFSGIFDYYVDKLLSTIDTVRQVAPVELLIVPGNHNEVMAGVIGKTLEVTYKNAKDVTVLRSPDNRVYTSFGHTGFLFCHGDKLPKGQGSWHGVILAEARAWGIDMNKVTHWVVVTGHTHTDKEIAMGSVTWITTPALCNPDDWHKHQFYVGNLLLAAAYFISKRRGYFANTKSSGAN